MLKCYVLDDLPSSVDLLCRYIERNEQTRLIGYETNSRSGFSQIISKKDDIDILFLDYEMPELNGDTIADIVKYDIWIVFVSGHPEFLEQSLEHYAVDFLKKPVFYERFEKTIEKIQLLRTKIADTIISAKSDNPEFLKVRSKGSYIFIHPKDVLYIELTDHYQKIFTKTEYYIINSTGEFLLNQLKNYNFHQSHKSYIVNVGHVAGIRKGRLIIRSSIAQIPIGRAYKGIIKKLLV